ncbi:lipid-A-disaccharide synthase [Ferrovum sp.]|uniref:lipid-A-disaccharide synthase n=1 Tax=Ferrovum sp. TaxID=2609467 RepID=UPI0026319AE6|nr:lipid-A-disaccharide synthase [Ferrovum sp.]
MRIGVVAGEASGDMLGEALMNAMRQRYPEAIFEGIAGPRMQALGARSLFPMEALSVRGYWEVLRALPRLLWIRRQLRRHFLSHPPDFFVGIDAPDFNLGLEKALKRGGIPTLQMVAPTVWAWRAERLPKIRAAVSGILSIFPFEAPIFEQAGIPLTYIGHPLVHLLPPPDRARARAALDPTGSGSWIALLPGSRMSELEYHGRLFLETALRLQRDFPQSRFAVPLINEGTRDYFQRLLREPAYASLPVTVFEEDATRILAGAEVALVASGTATLEAALLECPQILTYRLSGLTAWLVRRKGMNGCVGLPNIILGRAVVPEILQEQATPERLAEELGNLLRDAGRRADMRQSFREVRRRLQADTMGALVRGVEGVLAHAP